ncbi:MAG: TrbC/VirB2 family protein [Enterococcus malodoratus]
MKEMVFNLMVKAQVVGAVDIFQRISSAAKTFQNNLGIIAPIMFVCSAGIGALMFVFGRKGAESGKSHIFNVLGGVCLFVAAASIIATLFSIFGGNAQGI